MIKASEKEYEILKSEVNEIKSCITRYIGYIISIAGLSGLAIKYLERSDMYFPLLSMIIFTLAIILLFFDIILYKFTSHNRYVGYIQLMAQEVGYHKIEDTENNPKKTYLDKFNSEKSSASIDENIFSWEFVMSRFNTALFQNSKDRVLAASDKSKYVFKLPKGYEYKELGEEIYLKIDKEFFRKIIYQIYARDRSGPGFLKRNIVFPIKSLLRLYYPIKDVPYLDEGLTIDKKYVTTGWLYPRKIVQVATVPVLVLTALFFVISVFKFEDIFSQRSILGLALWFSYTVAIIAMFILWLKRYVLQLDRIIHGTASIEYYCWTFFLFRVQLLNSYGIVPVYFSRNFIRFFKLNKIYKFVNSNEAIIVTNKDHCHVCQLKKHYKSKDKSLIKKLFSSKDQVYGNDAYTDMNKACSFCFDTYKNNLISAAPFDKAEEKFHMEMNNLMKASLPLKGN